MANIQAATGFDKNSWTDINAVTKKTLEAIADKVYDADGDNSSFADVKTAYQKLSPEEKATFSVGTFLTGGAAPVMSLFAETLVDNAEPIHKAIEKKYANPPEKKAAEQLQIAFEKAGQHIEEFVDDVRDGRTYRDIKKEGQRFWRDNFTQRSPEQKLADKVSDACEDACDKVADFFDDVRDGRLLQKIK